MLRNLYDLGTDTKLVMKVFERILYQSKTKEIKILTQADFKLIPTF